MTLLGPSAGGGTSDSGQAWLVMQSISYTLASLPPSPPPQPSAPASPSSSSQPAPASPAPTQRRQSSSSPPPSSTPTPSSSSNSESSSRDPSTTPTVTADGEQPSSSPPTQSSTSSPSSAEATDYETTSGQSKPNDKTVVIGAVVGGVLALVLAALCSFWLFTRRQRQRPRSEPLLLAELSVTGPSSLNLATGYNTPSEKVPRRMAAPQSTVEPPSPSTVFGRGRPAGDVGGTLSPNSSGSHYESTPSPRGRTATYVPSLRSCAKW
ncbi:hypothetical protein EXIGLDRAFT_840397 [Exidia glandulosa HHB12029]|uniref:Mid2 domain-containing protein n=1 Tax=Exidia glandulosa HHB12029 TaxID=1314781 RepID=A0A165EGR6_EXIGL|nr:hypothetical protein EXIGLDRAFT_840397 [Exidia glandulosa HHB12029]